MSAFLAAALSAMTSGADQIPRPIVVGACFGLLMTYLAEPLLREPERARLMTRGTPRVLVLWVISFGGALALAVVTGVFEIVLGGVLVGLWASIRFK
jgi:hypothetical protein